MDKDRSTEDVTSVDTTSGGVGSMEFWYSPKSSNLSKIAQFIARVNQEIIYFAG